MGDLTGQGGGIVPSPSEYTATEVKTKVWSSTEDKIFPAGALYIKVYNRSLNNDITVNGQVIHADDFYEVEYSINEVNKAQEFCPAVTVLPVNQKVKYIVRYPQSHAIDINTL